MFSDVFKSAHLQSVRRPIVDEIEDPSDPPAIVPKHLEDGLHASSAQTFTAGGIKYLAEMVLQALKVLHEDGFVSTVKKGLSK